MKVYDMGRDLSRVDMTWSNRPVDSGLTLESMERAIREMFTLRDDMPLPGLWPVTHEPRKPEPTPPKEVDPSRPERKIVL